MSHSPETGAAQLRAAYAQPGIGIFTVYEEIGPLKAEEYLKRNTCNFRKLRPRWVDKLASDMSADRWTITHQGIAFNRKGDLVDGQHRLHAIMQSGTTITIAVTYNVEDQAVYDIDKGDPRTVREILNSRGVADIRGSHVAIARLICFPMANDNWTPSKSLVIAKFFQHEAAIRDVLRMIELGKKGVEVVSILTPMVRAWYSAERGKLQEFGQIVTHGFADGVETAAAKPVLLLRNFVLSLKTVGGARPTREIYLKTERALYAYLHNEPLNKLLVAAKEMFPLPEETEEA